ncbi:MAG: hypothetical protein RJA16_1708, partial [Planctomycetota bacterium]
MQASNRESCKIEAISGRHDARDATPSSGELECRGLRAIGSRVGRLDERLAEKPLRLPMPREHLDESRVVVEVRMAREDGLESPDAKRLDRPQGGGAAGTAIADAAHVDQHAAIAATDDDRGPASTLAAIDACRRAASHHPVAARIPIVAGAAGGLVHQEALGIEATSCAIARSASASDVSTSPEVHAVPAANAASGIVIAAKETVAATIGVASSVAGTPSRAAMPKWCNAIGVEIAHAATQAATASAARL